jgi:hypothetical protein
VDLKAQRVGVCDQVGHGSILMYNQVPIWPNAFGVGWNGLQIDEAFVWCIFIEIGFRQRELNQFDVQKVV